MCLMMLRELVSIFRTLSAMHDCLTLLPGDYYMTMLGEALLAIHEDNIPLMGTFAWGAFLWGFV